MSRPEIFSCDDINWPSLERLLGKIGGKETPEPEGMPEEATLPDLAIVQEHTQLCTTCGQKLIELARQHGVTKGDIFTP